MSIFDFEESSKIRENTTDQRFFFSDFCSVYSFGRKYEQRALLARFTSTQISVTSLSFQLYNRETASFIKIFIISIFVCYIQTYKNEYMLFLYKEP